jgi:branched-chain amino acid transport system substrate-binding protein
MAVSRRFLIAAATGAPLLARAANPAAPEPPASAQAGVLLPQSGPNALTGDECTRGIELALAELAAAGQAISLLPADCPDEARAGQAVKDMITARAAFVLGSGTSSISYAATASAELAQEPYIELSATADGITARGFKFLLRTCHTSSMIAGVATAAIAKAASGQKIALLFNTGATSGAIAGAAMAAFKTLSITPNLVVGYPESVADLREPVGRLRRAGTQILLHAGGGDDVLLLFQAMQDTGWRPAAIYGSGEGYDQRETAYALGTSFDGVFAVGAPCYPARAAGLAAAYQARYGMAPRAADSLTAYVGAKLVFETFNQVQGNAAKLLDALRRTDIPTGKLANGFGAAFDKNGQNTRSFAILQQWRGQTLTDI